MSYAAYNFLHILGVIFLFMALGGTIIHVINGGTKEDNAWRKPLSIIHGIAMLILLVGGFGLMARIGIDHAAIPGWIWGKLLIWVLLGAAIAIPYRVREWAKPLALIVPLLGALAAWLAIYQPF